MSLRRRHFPARSLAIYYGYGPLAALSQAELAVLEPDGWRPDDLARLRQSGVKTVAYLSVLEATPWVYRAARLSEADTVRLNGKPWRREMWDTVVVDPRSAAWRAHLEERMDALSRQGWDGVFLDGLGDVEDPEAQALATWLVPAAADLVRFIRELAGERLVIQNNGLWMLLPVVAEYIDAVAWEGQLTAKILAEPWALATQERLIWAHNLSGVQPIIIADIPDGPTAGEKIHALGDICRKLGFLLYAAPFDYAQGIRTPEGRVVRGKTAP